MHTAAPENIKRPNVFKYIEYRPYLKDMYDYHKVTKPGKFSYRYFSQRAGFRSTNFLKLVIEGKRNLSPQSISRFSDALGMSTAEAAFFRKLVMLNQAATVEDKKFYADQLFRSQTFRAEHALNKEQFDYYSNWYIIVIREMIGLEPFKNDPEWIARKLNPRITAQEAKKAMDVLFTLGLVRELPGGKVELTKKVVASNDSLTTASIGQYHLNMIQMAAESIDRHERELREVSSVTMNLSEETRDYVKELIRDFRKTLIEIALKEQGASRVFQVNIQLFPLTDDVRE